MSSFVTGLPQSSVYAVGCGDVVYSAKTAMSESAQCLFLSVIPPTALL